MKREALVRHVRHSWNAESWLVSSHADDRLAERCIEVWQVIAACTSGEVIDIDIQAIPNPKLLIRGHLADGTQVVAVWG